MSETIRLVCESCGRNESRRSHRQRFCVDCSTARRKHTARIYARQHPVDRDGNRRRGHAINALHKRSILHAIEYPASNRMCRVAMPFSWAWSKNHVWSLAGGPIPQREESIAAKAELTRLLSHYAGRFVVGKVWIDILVQKPNHTGDAVNVVDHVCDAVKRALDIDDRWFCIRRVDWEIVKDKPRLFVGISQDATEPQRVCSDCGRILSLSHFRGKHRECVSCRTNK